MTLKLKRHPRKGGVTGVRRQQSNRSYTRHVLQIMSTDATCERELCVNPAEHSLGSQLLCNLHYRQIIDPCQLNTARREHDLPADAQLGLGVFVAPHPDYPLRFLRHRFGSLRCDECGATWDGIEGEVCSWCIDRAKWARP